MFKSKLKQVEYNSWKLKLKKKSQGIVFWPLKWARLWAFFGFHELKWLQSVFSGVRELSLWRRINIRTRLEIFGQNYPLKLSEYLFCVIDLILERLKTHFEVISTNENQKMPIIGPILTVRIQCLETFFQF